MAKPKTSILVELNEKPAVEALKNLTKEFKRNAADWNQAAELIGKAYNVVAGAIGLAVDAIVKVTKAAIEAERIERRAIAAISLRGKVTQESIEKLKAFNQNLQLNLGLDADNLLQLQGTLASMGVRNNKLEEATKATIGLANATGKDLNSAVRVVAQAYQGKLGALARVGIVTKDVTVAQKKLADLFKLAEAQAGTLETRVNALTQFWGDFEETLGAAFTRSEALNKGIFALTETVVSFINIFGQKEGQILVDTFFRKIATGFALIGNAILGARQAYLDLKNSGILTVLDKLGPGSLVDALDPRTWIKHGGNVLNALRINAGHTGPEDFEQFGPAAPDKAAEAQAQAWDSFQRLINSFNAIGSGDASLLPPPKPGSGLGGGGGGKDTSINGRLFHRGEDTRGAAPVPFQVLSRKTPQEEIHDAFKPFNDAIAAESDKQAIQAQTDAADVANAWINGIRDAFQVGAQAIGSVIAQTINAAFDDADTGSFEKFLGDTMVSLGSLLIQTGVAASVLGLLSLIPGLKFIAGPPGLGIAAGLAATAAGIGMVAAGHALGGGGSAPANTSAPRTRTAGSSTERAPSAASNGFSQFGSAGQQLAPQNISISFNGWVGDESRTAREVHGALDRYNRRLRP